MRRSLVSITAALVAASAIAACSSSGSGGSSTSASSAAKTVTSSSAPVTSAPATNGSSPATTATGPDASGTVDAAKTAVASLTDVTSPVTLPMPTTPVKPGDPKVMIISCSLAAIGCKDLSDDVQEAAKAIGWSHVTLEDGQSVPATEGGFISQAIQQKYDAIIFVSVVAEQMTAQVDAASKAGIPMMCVECDTKSAAMKSKVTDVSEGGLKPGNALGDWIVANSNGKAKVLSLYDPFYPIVQDRIAGAAQEIKACSGCTYKQVNFPITDVGKPGPPTWTSTLSSNPKGTFDYVVLTYDTILSPVTQTARQYGRTELSIGSFDLSSPGLQAIQQGSPTALDVVPPLEYMGWAAVDLTARALAKQPMWSATDLPVRIADKDNAASFTAGYWKPNFDFQSKFKALWGA
jgi:ribose transport system substrate-binding protein